MNTMTSNEWQETTLDQLGRIVTGKTPSSRNHEYFGGGIPFVTPSDFDETRLIDSTERHLTRLGADAVKGAQIPSEAVMVTCIGSQMGQSAMTTAPSVTNQQINSIIVHPGNDALFIYYNLSNRREEIRSLASGSAVPILNKSAFGQLKISLPTLPVQQSIAHVLGTLDDKIELNRRMNQTLEAMASAIFQDWFVDFGPTRAKMEGQEPYLPTELWDLFPDELVDSELGEIPEGWEIKRLPELVDYKEGPGIRHWQYTNSNEGTRFINIRCIQNDDLLLETANRITNNEANGKYAHFHLKEFDIVVSTSGTLGRSAVVRPSHLPLVLNTSVIRFRPIEGATTFSYLYGYIKSAAFVDELEMSASGSVQKNFGPIHLKVMPMLCPPHSIIQELEQLASPLLLQMVAKRAESDVLLIQKQLLLPKLVAGELSAANLDLQDSR